MAFDNDFEIKEAVTITGRTIKIPIKGVLRDTDTPSLLFEIMLEQLPQAYGAGFSVTIKAPHVHGIDAYYHHGKDQKLRSIPVKAMGAKSIETTEQVMMLCEGAKLLASVAELDTKDLDAVLQRYRKSPIRKFCLETGCLCKGTGGYDREIKGKQKVLGTATITVTRHAHGMSTSQWKAMEAAKAKRLINKQKETSND